MLECLLERVGKTTTEPGQGSRPTVVPIIGSSTALPAYVLLTADNLSQVRVTEISDAGSVPVLQVANSLDVRVLLIDGQELIGAKQNRILNTDVLVPARSTIRIPVSCVEQGRWHAVSGAFGPGRAAGYRTRAAKAERVRASLKAGRGHDADQSAVWQEVDQIVHLSQAPAPTMALADAYQHRAADLERFRSEIRLPEGTVGVAVFDRQRFLGLDLFDRQSTLLWFWQALADSYAIDVLSTPITAQAAAKAAGSSAVAKVLQRVAAGEWEGFDTPGDGRDWRLNDPKYAATALVWENQSVLHLQVYPKLPTRQRAASPVRVRRPWGTAMEPPDGCVF